MKSASVLIPQSSETKKSERYEDSQGKQHPAMTNPFLKEISRQSLPPNLRNDNYNENDMSQLTFLITLLLCEGAKRR